MKEDATLNFSRIVQIGWVIGGSTPQSPATVKSALVKPEGFEISEDATRKHRITHEQAVREGRVLREVLTEFVTDVTSACRSGGGRVVAHQLEFDAAVIYEELGRCGLNALQDEWACVAKGGYCTMNPSVGRWLKECSGEEVGPSTTQHVLGLKDTLNRLLPKGGDDSRKEFQHHAADDDAQMTRLIYLALLTRTRPWTEKAEVSG